MKTKQILLILLIMVVSYKLTAQQKLPAAVSGMKMWLQIVPETNSDTANTYKFADYSGDSAAVYYYNGVTIDRSRKYKINKNRIQYFNYNPAIAFYTENQPVAIAMNNGSLSQATIIGVFFPRSNQSTNDKLIYQFEGREKNGFLLSKDKVKHSQASSLTSFDYGKEEGHDLMFSTEDSTYSLEQFKEQLPSVLSYYRAIKPNHSIWGESRESVFSMGDIFYGNSNAHIGTSTYTGNDFSKEPFTGYTAELIAYNRFLTPMERLRVESYLGLKYGITLKKSYLSAKGNILWDLSQNTDYNNRITGIITDSLSRLKQLTSTTSNAETPYYSDNYGSYNLGYNNKQNNTTRLLVIGRQPGNFMKDKQYFIWGDNNDELSTTYSSAYAGMKVMKRKWKAVCNIDSADILNGQALWQVSQHANLQEDNFELSLTKNAEVDMASILSSVPLYGKSGYVSFIDKKFTGRLLVKFGTHSNTLAEGSHDYGFMIDRYGIIYTIKKGKINSKSEFDYVNTGDKVEIFKEKNNIYLHINGERSDSCIVIDSAHENENYYTSISIIDIRNLNKTMVWQGIRYGGFTDTGNKIELSYHNNRAVEFTPSEYKNIYLLVDKTGKGDFTQKNLQLIESDYTDKANKKIVFNNVFFDTDANNKEAFTFAYISDFFAEIKTVDAGCQDSVALNDGKIDVNVIVGNPCFTYKLIDSVSQAEPVVIKEGTACEFDFSLADIPAGKYNLQLTQNKGITIKNVGKTGEESIAVTNSSVHSGDVQFTIKNTNSEYSIGFAKPVTSNNYPKKVMFGLKVKQNSIYLISYGNISNTALSSISMQDTIRIAKNAWKMRIFLNNTQIHQQNLGFEYGLSKLSCITDLSANTQSIVYLTELNQFQDNDWFQKNALVKKYRKASINYPVEISSPCANKKKIIKEDDKKEQNNTANASLTIEYQSHGGSVNYKAKVKLSKKSSKATLAVYTSSGILQAQYSMQGNELNKTANFTLAKAGLYIIKVFTNHEEFTEKIITTMH